MHVVVERREQGTMEQSWLMLYQLSYGIPEGKPAGLEPATLSSRENTPLSAHGDGRCHEQGTCGAFLAL